MKEKKWYCNPLALIIAMLSMTAVFTIDYKLKINKEMSTFIMISICILILIKMKKDGE